jgi:hypothetical protein
MILGSTNYLLVTRLSVLALTFHKRAVMLSVKSASENLRRNRHFGSAEFLDAASP